MLPKLTAAIIGSAALILPVTIAAPAQAQEPPGVVQPAPKPKAKPVKRKLSAAERARLHRLHLHHLRTLANLRARAKRAHRPHATRASTHVSGQRARVLRVAASLKGVRYRYGGTTVRGGLDCSGYTQYVFRKAGKRLPRTADQQRRAGHRVRTPRPGDLVVYMARGEAYHVGIAAGRGSMWAARKTGTRIGRQPIWGSPIYVSVLA